MAVKFVRAALIALALAAGGASGLEPPPTKPTESATDETAEVMVPVSRFRLEFVRVPGSADGSIKPFWLAKTETPWDAVDPFVFRLDQEQVDWDSAADAQSRPSRPYVPPDRGYGRAGFPAIGLSLRSAEAYAAWLSEKTGKRFRLPTRDEWIHAARGSADGEATRFGEGISEATLDAHAWHEGNSGNTPHRVGSRQAGPNGLHDMLGNVSEWVRTSDTRERITLGGSFRTPAAKLALDLAEPEDASWNVSDPQVPKSRWWLADAPFVGFRLVMEDQ